MRVVGRDLIRGGHYGQRSCEPHPKAEHMAAPTNAANVKKALANSEPSTHGTSLTYRVPPPMSVAASDSEPRESGRDQASAFPPNARAARIGADTQLSRRRRSVLASSTGSG